MAELDARDERNLPIVTRWLDFTTWLLQTTAGFPKHLRHSLVHHLDEEALQLLLLLTEASYRRRKLNLLREANLRLSRLRMLLEVAQRLGALSPGAHERALLATDEVGRMLGGWIRQVAGREGASGSPSPA